MSVPFFGDIAGAIAGAATARAQRRWMERMANTQYQRTVRDMNAAGLNPMMMFQSGGGPQSVPSAPPGEGEAIQRGLSAASAKAMQLPLMRAQIENFGAQKAKLESDAQLNDALRGQANAQQRSIDRATEIQGLDAITRVMNMNPATLLWLMARSKISSPVGLIRDMWSISRDMFGSGAGTPPVGGQAPPAGGSSSAGEQRRRKTLLHHILRGAGSVPRFIIRQFATDQH